MKNSGAIILSGGEGRRLGGLEKGLLTFDGERLIKRKVRLLKDHFAQIIIVANKPELYQDLGEDILIVQDDVSYQGPLRALFCGLNAAKHPVNFLTAVDMPFINLALLEYFYSFIPDYQIVVPKIKDQIEPLFGLYSKSILPTITENLKDTGKGLISVIEQCKTKEILEQEIVLYDQKLVSFVNINQEADIKKAGSHI